MSVSKTFSDAGVSSPEYVKAGDSISYAVDYSADFDGGLFLEYTQDGGQTYSIERTFAVGYKTDVSTTYLPPVSSPRSYRFRCILDPDADPAVLTGTAAVTISTRDQVFQTQKNNDGTTLFEIDESGVSTLVRASQKTIYPCIGAKAGATAGWVVGAGDNVSLVTLPASQTGSTLVVPIPAKVGSTITGFHLVGQIESAGNAVTVDAALRKHTAAAADVADASVGAITQLSVTADTIMSSANTEKASLSEVVGADETFYVLITATTGASTDIALQGVAVTVTEA